MPRPSPHPVVLAVVVGLSMAPRGLSTAAAQPGAVPGSVPEDESPSDDTIPMEPDQPDEPPEPGDAGAFVDDVHGTEGMVRVAGVSFMMGASDARSPSNERPKHLVTVAPFWMDRTEVTVGAYRACVEARGCERPARSSPWCTYDAGDPRLPVSCVRWRDADAFCRVEGKRLPREAEWELASRGSRGARYPWGGVSGGCYFAATLVNDTTGRACTRGPSRVGAHPHGATSLGLQDLSGNVEEWVADWYVEDLAHGGVAASGASHVLRGGGWLSQPSAARTTSRDWGSALEAGPNVGFRCARSD